MVCMPAHVYMCTHANMHTEYCDLMSLLFSFCKGNWLMQEDEAGKVCVCMCVCLYCQQKILFCFSNCGWFGHSYETRSQLKMSLIWPRWGFEFGFQMNQFLSPTRNATLCSSWALTLAILLKQSILLRNIRCVMTVLSEFSFVVLADELFHMKEVKNC